MLLERIDIDQQGPLHQVQLGPFSHKLNAIFGTAGVGKTTVLHFLRETMLGELQPSQPLQDIQRGRVVWAGRDGLMHCVRGSDGGLVVDFEPRNGQPVQHGQEHAHRLAHVSQSVVDGIITSSNEHSITQAIAAAHRAGLDDLQTSPPQDIEEQNRLKRRIAELDRFLHSDLAAGETVASLDRRLTQLTAELARIDRYDAYTEQHRVSATRRQWALDREGNLERDLHRLLDQKQELQRMLDEIDAERSAIARHATVEQPRYSITDGDRQQLEELDNQLIRWRRTLFDVRQLRSRLAKEFAQRSDRQCPERPVRSSSAVDSLHALESRLEATQREIDWLASRYDLNDHVLPQQTFPNHSSELEYRSLSQNLQDLKDQLQQINSRLFHRSPARSGVESPLTWTRETKSDLSRCERELLTSIDHLIRHRNTLLDRIAAEYNVPLEQIRSSFGDWRPDVTSTAYGDGHATLGDWLLSPGCPPEMSDRRAHSARVARLESDRLDYSRELDATVRQIQSIRDELTQLQAERSRLSVQEIPVDHRSRHEVMRERQHVHDLLSRAGSHSRYQQERDVCVARLRELQQPVATSSRLATRVTYWLQRLSAGRMKVMQWETAQQTNLHPAATYQRVYVDGRSDTQLSLEERYLAALAVRMAAIDELAQRGYVVPLLIETPSSIAIDRQAPVYDNQSGSIRPSTHYLDANYPYAGYRFEHAAYDRPSYDEAVYDHGYHRASVAMPNWLDTVMAFADAGHQTILLTRHRELADRVAAAGGTVHGLDRPNVQPRVSHPQPAARPSTSYNRSGDVNRDLDAAWQETYSFDDTFDRYPTRPATRPLHSAERPAVSARIYAPPQDPPFGSKAGHREAAPSPFFLTADSPVDQAPSIDAVAGARLRGVGIARIGQLLVADPGRLSDAIGMPNVDEAAMLRWQNEARLVCRVPQLRPFDARVLVGCGVTDPKHLAGMHPGELLDRVEAFLATERGLQILRSGSSYELSRITSWIAAANRSVSRESRHGRRNNSSRRRHLASQEPSVEFAPASTTSRSERPAASDRVTVPASRHDHEGYDRDGFDRSGYDRDGYNRNGYSRAGFNRAGYDRDGHSQSTSNGQSRSGHGSSNGYSQSSDNHSRTPSEREPRSRRDRDNRERTRRNERVRAERQQYEQDRSDRERQRVARDAEERQNAIDAAENDVVPMQSSESSESANWRFYLERNSPIVDAPTIGPRTANKLEKIGLITVGDLLQADPDDVANRLNNRRIDADEVRQWQRQSALVCRIPMLRGHDAQLLVAADVYDPERIASSDADWLLNLIEEVVDTTEGKRILRGSTPPDHAEIVDWIRFAQHHRELRAA